VLVQIQPPFDDRVLVCVFLSRTKPLLVTPIRLPLQSIFLDAIPLEYKATELHTQKSSQYSPW
jgi:hypothetical protein